jgi:hypothetical protein
MEKVRNEEVRTSYCSHMGVTKVPAEFWSINVKDLLTDLGVNGRIILKHFMEIRSKNVD